MLIRSHVDHMGWTGVYLHHDNLDVRKTLYAAGREWCTARWGKPSRKERWYCTNAWFMFRDAKDAVMFKLSLEHNT